MRFLLSLVLIFQGVVNGPTTINGPSSLGGVAAGGSVITYSGVHCISNSAASMNCQLTSVPASAKIAIQFTDNVTATTVTSVFVCGGTVTCGSSTDTIATDVAPVAVGGASKFAAYSDMTATLTGNVMVTVIVASQNAPRVFAQVFTGGCVSSCFDKSGTSNQTTTSNYTTTTSANVTAANELAIAEISSSVTLTAGTTALCASSACTRIDINGGQAVEYSSTSPTNGATASLTWTNASGTGIGLIVTYK